MFIIQEIGNLGTVLIGLPIAILIGLRREAIGATLGIGREGELAYISEKYTLESPEGRGVISLYVIGTLFGTMFFSIFAPILLDFGFRVEALAMASGVGSGSMMSAASATLVARVPEMENTILAYASASQLLTSFIGTFTMVFLAAPLQQFMYKFLVRGDKKNEPTMRRYVRYALVLLLSVALILFAQEIKLIKNPDSTPITSMTFVGLGILWLFSFIGVIIADLMKLVPIKVIRDFPILGWVSITSLSLCLVSDFLSKQFRLSIFWQLQHRF